MPYGARLTQIYQIGIEWLSVPSPKRRIVRTVRWHWIVVANNFFRCALTFPRAGLMRGDEEIAPMSAIRGDQLRDFGGTVTLVEAMGLVISVDTSVAHLAGLPADPGSLRFTRELRGRCFDGGTIPH